MDDSTVFDDALFSILKDCKTLPNFLNCIFGFLRRRTDFYCIASGPNSHVGLPPGYAEHFTKQTFHKWKPSSNPNESFPSVVANEEEVITSAIEDINLNANKHEGQPSEVVPETHDTSSVCSLSNNAFTSSECYNGATYDSYSWSQTITEVEVIVQVPHNITSKDLTIDIQPQKISVKIKSDAQFIIEGELCQKVKHSDMIWSLDKQKLEIHLEKVGEVWWDCLLKNEPKLDVSKIDCSRPFEDLPEEAQAKIEELTWNQDRKRLGLPTSEQLVLQERLKRAWNAKGSPFQGPYDPSAVVIN